MEIEVVGKNDPPEENKVDLTENFHTVKNNNEFIMSRPSNNDDNNNIQE